MRKEMVVAIVLGLLLGGGAAYGLVAFPGKFSQAPSPTITPSEKDETTLETTPQPSPIQGITLEILLPENQALTQEEEITISGKTKGKALVAVSSPVDEQVTVAEDDGAFSERVKLSEGSNEIVVVSRINGLEAEKRIIVNYTNEEI